MRRAGQGAGRIASKPQKQALSSNRPTKDWRRGFYTDTEETRSILDSRTPTPTACACRRTPPPCPWWQERPANMGKHCRRGPKPRRTGGRGVACLEWKRYGGNAAPRKKQPYLQTDGAARGEHCSNRFHIPRDWRGSSKNRRRRDLGLSLSANSTTSTKGCQAKIVLFWAWSESELIGDTCRSRPGLVN